jgi:hypothetical protein
VGVIKGKGPVSETKRRLQAQIQTQRGLVHSVVGKDYELFVTGAEAQVRAASAVQEPLGLFDGPIRVQGDAEPGDMKVPRVGDFVVQKSGYAPEVNRENLGIFEEGEERQDLLRAEVLLHVVALLVTQVREGEGDSHGSGQPDQGASETAEFDDLVAADRLPHVSQIDADTAGCVHKRDAL